VTALIQDAIGLVPSPPINAGISDLISLFTAEQRRITGTETYLNAEDQEVDPETATAANIGEDRNARVNSLQLANYAVFQKRLFERGFELGQENYGDLRMISTMDQDRRQRITRELRRDDLMGAIQFYVERDSWLPNLRHKQRAAFAQGVGVYAQAQAAGIANPQFIKKLNQVYDIDLMSDRRNERVADCEEILDEMRQAAPAVVSPEELYLMNPIDPTDPHHEIKALWWQDMKSRREARNYHPFVLLMMERYMVEHAMYLIQMRGTLAGIAAIGQGLIAPPVSSGLSAAEQKPPAPVMMPPGKDGESKGAQPAAEKPADDSTQAGEGALSSMFATV
jgi:hypothetical protein